SGPPRERRPDAASPPPPPGRARARGPRGARRGAPADRTRAPPRSRPECVNRCEGVRVLKRSAPACAGADQVHIPRGGAWSVAPCPLERQQARKLAQEKDRPPSAA